MKTFIINLFFIIASLQGSVNAQQQPHQIHPGVPPLGQGPLLVDALQVAVKPVSATTLMRNRIDSYKSNTWGNCFKRISLPGAYLTIAAFNIAMFATTYSDTYEEGFSQSILFYSVLSCYAISTSAFMLAAIHWYRYYPELQAGEKPSRWTDDLLSYTAALFFHTSCILSFPLSTYRSKTL